MTRVYNELKTKHQKETNNLQQLQREIDRLNQITQTSEEFIKSIRNLTSIKGKTVPVEEQELNYLQRSLEKERATAQFMTRDAAQLKKEIIQTKIKQQKIQTENAELRKEIIQIRAKQQQKQTKCL